MNLKDPDIMKIYNEQKKEFIESITIKPIQFIEILNYGDENQ